MEAPSATRSMAAPAAVPAPTTARAGLSDAAKANARAHKKAKYALFNGDILPKTKKERRDRDRSEYVIIDGKAVKYGEPGYPGSLGWKWDRNPSLQAVAESAQELQDAKSAFSDRFGPKWLEKVLGWWDASCKIEDEGKPRPDPEEISLHNHRCPPLALMAYSFTSVVEGKFRKQTWVEIAEGKEPDPVMHTKVLVRGVRATEIRYWVENRVERYQGPRTYTRQDGTQYKDMDERLYGQKGFEQNWIEFYTRWAYTWRLRDLLENGAKRKKVEAKKNKTPGEPTWKSRPLTDADRKKAAEARKK
jgi:hypothetical protein